MLAWLGPLAMALLFLASTGCKRGDDCELYHSCEGDLVDWAVEKVADDKKDACRSCLRDNCLPQANECTANWECNLGARCRMTTSPLEYQTCIRALYRHGYTAGEEPKKPWEGQEPNPFDECRRTHCPLTCQIDPYDCDVAVGNYQDASVTLAVQKFGVVQTDEPAYGIAKGAMARVCYLDTCPKEFAPADEHGHITLTLEADMYAEAIYFEVVPDEDAGAPDFPKTLYYPRILGEGKSLLGSVYVVRNADIKNGNSVLGFGDQVLADRAQSVILPDGCTRERVSVPNVSIKVTNSESGETIPQCNVEEPGCFPHCNNACIWYSSYFMPTRFYPQTDEKGTGAGVVGLAEGLYEIEVWRDGGVVARRRRVEMRNGWMTIVRTWPVLRAGGK